MRRQDANMAAFRVLNRELVKAVMANPQTAIIRASGRFEGFIQSESSVEISANRFVKYTVPYTAFIDRGKPPGAWPDIKALEKWVERKKYGITYSSESEKKSIAYLIARKQAKEGSYKFRPENKSERTNIVEQAIKQSLPIFEQELGRVQTRWFESEVQKEIEKINNL